MEQFFGAGLIKKKLKIMGYVGIAPKCFDIFHCTTNCFNNNHRIHKTFKFSVSVSITRAKQKMQVSIHLARNVFQFDQ